MTENCPALLEAPTETGVPAKAMLSVVLIGFDERRRDPLASALERQQVLLAGDYTAYPDLRDPSELNRLDCDVAIVNIDAHLDVALDVVERISGRSEAITVMAYSARRDPQAIVQCMRAGAREFLSELTLPEVLAGALMRAATRKGDLQRRKKLQGKIILFCGAKGGSGVTTLATNFAIALKQETGGAVALVDLKAQLGDVAGMLGLAPSFNIMDALRNYEQLDQEFLSTLMTEHRSGLSVLASPDRCASDFLPRNGNLRKLLSVMRERFPYVVVDGGASLDPGLDVACRHADFIYVVAQVEIPALRNAQRLIEHVQRAGDTEGRVDVVLNRYDARPTDLSDSRLAKVLSVPLKWKMPNDYFSVNRSLSSGTPLALENSAISRSLHRMAREACGKPARDSGRKWGLFN